MRRRPGGRSASREGATREHLQALAAEAPAILRRPLPGLLVDAAVLEYERALAAHRFAAAGSEHDAGADAYSAAAADPEADRRASPGAHSVGHPRVHVAAVRKLRAARGCAPAQHHLVVSRAVPAAPRFGELAARGSAAGKQNYDQHCDSHKYSFETKRPEDFSPGRRPAVRHAGLTAGGNPKSAD